MTSRLSTVVASTHPPRYRLHKYWSRKPYNVVQSFIDGLLPEVGVVVDPYVGSGVTAWEAANLGHQVYAGDVNPVAIRLATVTTHPPDAAAFEAAMNEYLHVLASDVRPHWATDEGMVRYVVHEVQSDCPGCGQTCGADGTVKTGRTRRCPQCHSPMSFNMEVAVGTKVTGVVTQELSGVQRKKGQLTEQQLRCEMWFGGPKVGPLFAPMTVNRRILAFPNMVAADLFTPRALSTLLRFRELILACPDPAIRDCGLLMLTASSAQCSRLTAFRNNLSTGGPAWSVPGFWMPPVHIEANPVLHLQARLKRFVRGLRDLKLSGSAPCVQIRKGPAQDLLSSLYGEGVRADLVILDPPYGDSVPFTEFSWFWNALLGQEACVDDDISVSDRMHRDVAWQNYRQGLGEMFQSASQVLSSKGRILLTFNNNDADAWEALYGEAQRAGLGCDEAQYQIPAVVSSKAAFHPDGSYTGDIWAVLSPRGEQWEPSRNLEPARVALARIAAFRNGRVARNLVRRTLALTWLAHNIDAELISTWPELIGQVFSKEGKHMLEYQGTLPVGVPVIDEYVSVLGRQLLDRGVHRWKDLYAAVAEKCAVYGIPDAGEVRQILEPMLLELNQSV